MKLRDFINKAGALGLAVVTGLSLFPSNVFAEEPEIETTSKIATVYVMDSEGGSTTVNGESSVEAEEGETVRVNATADEEYHVVNTVIAYEDGSVFMDEGSGLTEFEFQMPESDVYVTTWYEKESNSVGEEVAAEEPADENPAEEPVVEEETQAPEAIEEPVVEETQAETEPAVIENKDDTKPEEAEKPENEEPKDIYATDKNVDISGKDFSSARLIIATGNADIFVDKSVVVSSFRNVYILQFKDSDTAKKAYKFYYDKADMIDIDTGIMIAEGEAAGDVSTDTVMTKSDNPLSELKEALAQGSASYDIAIIDTGANNSNVSGAVSMIGDSVGDGNGHGTSMARYIAEENPNARVLSIKAFGSDGIADISAVYAAFEYAIAQDVSIINLSASAYATEDNAILESVINRAVSMGIIVVGSAGNNGSSASYFIPGGISSATIIGAADATGARLASSNYGGTVDYNVVADSTSEAAARFSGFISTGRNISDVLNKGLIFSTDFAGGYTPESGDPAISDIGFVITDDGGGGAGDGGAGQAATDWVGCGVEFVWFDRGGWYGDSVTAAQGYYNTGDANIPDVMYNTFVNQLEAQIADAMRNPSAHRAIFASSVGNNFTLGRHMSGRFATLRNSMKQACINAIGRAQNQTQRARVVGVAVTWSLFGGDGHYYWSPGDDSTYTYEVHGVEPSGGSNPWNTFRNLFARRGNSTELPAANGWDDAVNQTLYNNANNNERWRDYIYRMGEADNAAAPGEWQVYAVAVTDLMEPPVGYIQLQKASSNTTVTDNNPNYSLADCIYGVYDGNTLIGRFKTDASGTGYVMNGDSVTSSTTMELNVGTYSVKEIQAPRGYNIDYNSYNCTVASNQTTDVSVTDSPKMDPLFMSVIKAYMDANGVIKTTQRITHDDTQFRFDYYANYDWSGTPLRSWVLKTDERGTIALDEAHKVSGDDFYYDGSSVSLPKGSIKVTEIKAAEGFRLPTNGVVAYGIYSDEDSVNGTVYSSFQFVNTGLPWATIINRPEQGYTGIYVGNQRIRGGVSIQKLNKEIGIENEGLSSLEDCVYKVVNVSGNDVKNEDESKTFPSLAVADYNKETLLQAVKESPDSVVLTLTTDNKGFATTSDQALEFGTYLIYEESANDSMQVNDSIHEVVISENGVIVEVEDEDPIVRGDLQLIKTNSLGSPKANIPFLIVSYDENGNALEAHVAVTDANGYINTADLDNTNNTNGFDAYVKFNPQTKEYYVTEEGEALLASGEASNYGVWFSAGRNVESGALTGNSAVPTNDRGALYYGLYKVFEIQCSDNADNGENLLYSKEFIPINKKVATLTADGDIISERSDYLTRNSNIFVDFVVDVSSAALDALSSAANQPSHVTYADRIVEMTETINYGHIDTDTEYKWVIEFVETENPTNVLSTVTVDRFKPSSNSQASFTVSTAGTITGDFQGTPEVVSTGNVDTTGLGGKSISAKAYLYEYVTGYDFDADSPETVEGCNLIQTHNLTCEDEEEKVFVPAMDTTAYDGFTQDNVGTNIGATTIIDNVELTNIGPKEYYILEETIMDKATGDVYGEVDVMITPVYVDRTNVNVVETYTVDTKPINIDTEKWDGDKTLVVYEKLWRVDSNGNKIDEFPLVSHESLLDEDETIFYPSVFTNASDSVTGDHVGTVDEQAYIYDEVTLKNLIPGKEYRLGGTVRYVTDVEDADGNIIKHRGEEVDAVLESAQLGGADISVEDGLATFTAETSEEFTITLAYALDSTALEGYSAVVFEDLYHNGVRVATHSDLDDEDQTIHYPLIRTIAVDGMTEDKAGVIRDDATIIDTVMMKNLIPGMTYTVTGALYDQISGQLVEQDNIVVTGEKFVAVSAEEEHTVTFEHIDTTELGDFSLVAFERLYHNYKNLPDGEEKLVAVHEDITDAAQTIHYPTVMTSAVDSRTGDHVGSIFGQFINSIREFFGAEVLEDDEQMITDTVTMTNLVPGYTYTVSGVLMNRDTGEAITIDGEKVVQNATFTLSEDGKITTEGGENAKVLEFDKEHNRIDVTVDLQYVLDSSAIQGITTIVFEDLIHNNVILVSHNDLADDAQSVNEIAVASEAVDSHTKDHVGDVPRHDYTFETVEDEDTSVIVETIDVQKLVYGEEYTVNGALVVKDESADKPMYLTAEGTVSESRDDAIQTEITFVADEDSLSDAVTSNDGFSISGSIELRFELDRSAVEGLTLVVVDDFYHNDVLISTHSDIDNELQSVHYPKIRTNASDIFTTDDVGTVAEETTVVDIVTYNNLLEDEEYTISGVLVYQQDCIDKNGVEHKAGEPVCDAAGNPYTSTVTLKAGEHGVDGEETLEFVVDSSVLAGTTAVAFEELEHNDITVTAHADISDKPQTVHYPDVFTNAVDSRTGDHVGSIFGRFINSIREFFGEEILDEDEQMIIDSVSLVNLVPGRTYTVNGVLMDKNTGEKLLIDGKEITQTATLTVSEDGEIIPAGDENAETYLFDEEHNRVDGMIELRFVLDSSAIQGHTVVVFEDLVHNDIIVASHSDIDDTVQSVNEIAVQSEAVDKATEDHVGDVPRHDYTFENVADEETSVIVETIDMQKLVYGEEYTVNGALVVKDESADKPMYLTPDGGVSENREDAVQTEITFVANEDELIDAVVDEDEFSVSGSIELEFELSKSAVEGLTLVVVDDFYHDGVLISTHSDIDNELQSVHYPKIRTNASDILTTDDVGTVSGYIKVKDVVTYNNLLEDEEYIISGVLVYQQDCIDKNGVEHKAGEPVYTPEGTSDVLVKEEYDEDVTKNVYTCECGETFESWAEVEAHQAETECASGEWNEVTETVHHDAEYETVEFGGDLVTASAVLAAGEHGTDGEVELVFELDSSVLAGVTLVAFETLEHNDITVTAHADISDKPQTIHYPDIFTTAVDSRTGDHVGSIFGDLINSIAEWLGFEDQEDSMQTIVDTVTLVNLVPGRDYTIGGLLMNKEAQIPVIIDDNPVIHTANIHVNEDGTLTAENGELTTTLEFDEEHNSVTGQIELEFTFDSSKLVAYETEEELAVTTVVFELLAHNGILVARHLDFENADQTVYEATIKTTALDVITGDHVGDTPRKADTADNVEDEKVSVINDRVYLDGLKAGEEYTVEGRLILTKETQESEEGVVFLSTTGEPTLDVSEAVASSLTFTVSEENMTDYHVNADGRISGAVDLEFVVESEAVAGKCVTVFEGLIHNDVTITFHCDPYDENQTIWYPNIGTTAFDINTAKLIIEEGGEMSLGEMSHVGVVGETTIADVVEFNNLMPDEDYTISGRLVYAEDILDENGEIIHKAGNPFCMPEHEEEVLVKEAYDETVESYVIECEECGEKISAETPEEAIAAYKAHIEGHVTDRDNLEYWIVKAENAEPELVEEVIHHEAEYETVKVGDTPYTAEYELKAGEHEINGFAMLTFDIDSTSLRGTTITVEEVLIHNGVVVTTHAVVEDEDQQIYFPQILETILLSDAQTGIKNAIASKDMTLTDTVYYANLIPGKTYTLKGVLMDKETGKPALDDNGKEITAETEFVPEDWDGIATVEFKFSGVSLAGHSLVAFETLYYNDTIVNEHKDITDTQQSLNIPKVQTEAKFANPKLDKEGKTAYVNEDQIIIDTVSVSGLVYGETYKVSGVLMNKDKNTVVTTNGKEITAELEFVATEKTIKDAKVSEDGFTISGTVTLTFTVPKSTILGKAVVFETLNYVKTDEAGKKVDIVVGEHKDINDEAQTVTFIAPTPTGDVSIFGWVIAGISTFVLAVAGIIWFIIRRKKRA